MCRLHASKVVAVDTDAVRAHSGKPFYPGGAGCFNMPSKLTDLGVGYQVRHSRSIEGRGCVPLFACCPRPPPPPSPHPHKRMHAPTYVPPTSHIYTQHMLNQPLPSMGSCMSLALRHAHVHSCTTCTHVLDHMQVEWPLLALSST